MSSIIMIIQLCNGGVTMTLLEAKHCIVYSYMMCYAWRFRSLKMAQSELKRFGEIIMYE